ncbi:MAG TPA: ATP-binding protein [Verrucomicrobiae bacterium]|nr:ATP-binding protein [Verrucomicrobiae bacterium]
MAVKLKNFHARFQVKLLLVGFLLQVLVGVLLYFWLQSAPTTFGIASHDYLLLFFLPFSLLEVMAIAITIAIATEPTKLIADAVTHASNSANQEAPLPVNEERYIRSGLKDLVLAIYGLAARPLAGGGKKDTSSSLYRHIFSQLPFGIIVLDASRTIIHYNVAAPLRENPTDFRAINLLFDQNNSLETWLKNSEENGIATEQAWSRVAEKTDTGERRYYDVFASYHKNGSAGVETIIMTIDRTKDYGPDEEHMEFIALAAHELRGPITVIRGYLDVLADELADKLAPDQKALMDRLSVSANRLSGYVNNILGAARYDRRHLKLYLYEQRPSQLFAGVSDDLQLRAHTLNRLLAADIPADLPTVAADKTSIGEVVVNLVDNAIKYSNEGGQIVISARVAGEFVEFSVQDFGIGIPAPIIQKLFTKFYRSHRSRETAAGSGLGLYISKAIVESHGGTISVRSTEGHGSTFSFTLPIYKTVADKLAASNNSNEGIIENSNGWIRNHAMYRG